MKKILIIAVIAAAFSIAGGLPSAAQTKVTIKVKGADSMWGRIRSLALLYMKDHPQVDIAISANSLCGTHSPALRPGPSS